MPPWRARLRLALGRSRFIRALDAAGALVWPKSFTFVATKAGSLARDPAHAASPWKIRAIPRSASACGDCYDGSMPALINDPEALT